MSSTSHLRMIFCALILAACALAAAPPARAQVRHAAVSANGADNRVCDRANPCRTLEAAVAAVEAGGQVSVLTSGVYEPFVVNKSVQVVAPEGVHAVVTAASGYAITVNTGASDVVVLRGLYLDGQSTASAGIRVSAPAAAGPLHVEGCVISNFKGPGLYFYALGGGQLYVKDTTSRNNLHGLHITSNVRAAIDHCRFEQNMFDGLTVRNGARATVRDSLAAGNSTDGDAETGGFHTIDGHLTLENCVTVDNYNGIRAEGGVVQVSNTMVADNKYGLVNAAGWGQLISFGNNRLRGNVVNGSFTLNAGQK